MRVLITGAGGSIGRALGPGLTTLGHQVDGIDLVEPAGSYWNVGDLTDPAVAGRAVSGVDAVVHLAGFPTEASLADSLASHVLLTETLLDAMVEHGVTRIAYASSNHAAGLTPRQNLMTAGTRPRPDTNYGVAKVATEGLLSLYCDRYGVDAVAMRIGSYEERPRVRRNLATWLSPGDCVRMVHAAITAPAPGFAVVYGISANSGAWWDLAPGRALGYEPQDDAADYAAELPDRDEDADEAAYAGGPYAWAHQRP